MTERQKALLENLPKCNHNVTKAALMSGYSELTARKAIHTMLGKNRLKGIKSEEEVKKKYLKDTIKLKKKFLKDGDNTNTSRMHEVIGKVEGLFKETVVNEGNLKEITVVYGNNTSPSTNNTTPIISPSMNKPIDNPSTINKDNAIETPSINQGNEINKDNDNDTNPVSISQAIGKVDDRMGGGDGK